MLSSLSSFLPPSTDFRQIHLIAFLICSTPLAHGNSCCWLTCGPVWLSWPRLVVASIMRDMADSQVCSHGRSNRELFFPLRLGSMVEVLKADYHYHADHSYEPATEMVSKECPVAGDVYNCTQPALDLVSSECPSVALQHY